MELDSADLIHTVNALLETDSDSLVELLRRAGLDKHSLSGLCFDDMDLRGDDLSSYRLDHASFRYAQLGPILNKTDFTHSDLRWANLLKKSQLVDAVLRHSKASDANFNESNLAKAQLEHADFSYARLRKADLREAKFENATLECADLSLAQCEKTNFISARLDHANFLEANLQGADFSHSRLRWARLRNSNLQNAILKGADLSSADLRGADLTGADLSDTDFSWALMRGAKLDGNRSQANLAKAIGLPFDESPTLQLIHDIGQRFDAIANAYAKLPRHIDEALQELLAKMPDSPDKVLLKTQE